MREVDGRSAARVVLLALILAILGGFKLAYLPGTGPFGLDGSFYVNAARNVQEGAGLKTNIAMYHSGELELPTRSRQIYPLWPLLLGWVSRLTGLFPAVNYLPPFLYLCDLLLLYFLTQRLAEVVGASIHPVVTPGHLVVLMVGTNWMFFATSTYPYTEPLGFLFAIGSILVMDRALRKRSVAFASLSGILAGCALLTRTQLILVGLSLLLAFVWTAVCERTTRLAASFAATYALVAGYWYVGFFSIRPGPRVELPPLNMWSQPPGPWEFVAERLEGITVSLTPLSPYSYFNAFGVAFVLPLIAIALGLVRWWRSKTFCIRNDGALICVCVLISAAAYATLNLYHHPEFFIPWLFGYRHALPLIFGIIVSFVFLIGAGRSMRTVAILTLGIAILWNGWTLVGRVTTPRTFSPTAAERSMFAWLASQPEAPVLLTARPQHVSVYTRAKIHWTECRTPASVSRLMLERLPIDYVLVYPGDRECEFIAGLHDVLELGETFGEEREAIYVLTRHTAK